ncbi:acyltransferase family protein [Paeniroseomonas aquatica]|uniref:acyltransferase family protein n=1 Tax=Paeniroseomonas aquatica TaxID=373043 RepID=UPI003612D868
MAGGAAQAGGPAAGTVLRHRAVHPRRQAGGAAARLRRQPAGGAGGGLRDLFLTTARSPALSVWYLLVLFLCTIVALLLRRLGSTGLVLLGLALQFLEVPPLVYLDRFASHFLFFAAGLWVAERQGRMLPAFEAWQPLWWAAFALGIAAAELEWLDARWSMVLCGLLCIPALHGAIRRPPVSAWQWPLALGRYAMAIYLFNTLAIGGGKAVLIAGGIGWTEAWFPLHVAVAMALGLGVPVLLKRLVLRRIPPVDRLTD